MDGVETNSSKTATATSGRALVKKFSWLPVQVTIETQLTGFTVRDLLSLGNETVVRSGVGLSGRIPLLVNGKLIAWAKLEVSNQRLAARITELA